MREKKYFSKCKLTLSIIVILFLGVLPANAQVMRTNTDFEAPIGALVEVENGEICSSNDF